MFKNCENCNTPERGCQKRHADWKARELSHCITVYTSAMAEIGYLEETIIDGITEGMKGMMTLIRGRRNADPTAHKRPVPGPKRARP